MSVRFPESDVIKIIIMATQDEQGRVDRISALPDEILCVILSLLSDIKDVVKTSVLSKRWKSMWTNVGVVQIRDIDYFSSPNMYIEQKAIFTKFATSVFIHLQPLRVLKLTCYRDACAEQWFDIVINKLYSHAASLQELDLRLVDPTRLVRLPPGLLTSKQLVVLKISFNMEDLASPVSLSMSPSSPPPSMLVCRLPSLKVLHLSTGHENYRMDLSSVHNILTGCPVLEELHLSGYMHSHMTLCIKSSSLKRLKVFFWSYHSTMEIDASNLEEFDLTFNMVDEDQIFIAEKTLSLATRVRLAITTRRPPRPKICYGDRLIRQFLAKAINAKYLFLSSHLMMNLEYSGLYQQLPVFNNLTDLKLDICFFTRCHFLTWFLKSSPKLVQLSIWSDANSVPTEADRLQYQRARKCWTTMMLRHLEKVELIDFRGSRNEMELVGYLLDKAPVLKEIIFFPSPWKKEAASEIRNKVVNLPKAPDGCRVIVSEET